MKVAHKLVKIKPSNGAPIVELTLELDIELLQQIKDIMGINGLNTTISKLVLKELSDYEGFSEYTVEN